MGVARAQHHRLQDAGGAHVGHESAVAGEEGLGAEPGQRRADHDGARAERVTRGIIASARGAGNTGAP